MELGNRREKEELMMTLMFLNWMARKIIRLLIGLLIDI